MLVYGDRVSVEDPRAKLDRIETAWTAAAAQAASLHRHGALVGAFVEASELAQGLADLEFEAAGEDDVTPLQDAAMGLLMALARAVAASWSGTHRDGEGRSAFVRLRALLPADAVRAKEAEGHAFYAVYPEAYWEAARALRGPVRCLGLRSIGGGLAAMAAAATGTAAPLTLRPVGPPFRRELRPSARLRRRLTAGPATWAVADEGPGLSGSSFGAAADLLEAEGVPRERIVFLPSHAGAPGPQADPAHARRWAEARRLTVDFDVLSRTAHGACPPLDRWFSDRLGEPVAPLEDLSAGAWRTRRFAGEALWPPAHSGQERRKFLLRTARGAWLLKFAGLGREGRAKLDRAVALYGAGFATEPAGLRHGFLAERWREDARPLGEGERPPVERLAAYLRFRGARFPAERSDGASIEALAGMARANTAEALGAAVAARLAWTDRDLADLQRATRPVRVDGRLHRWEWLALPDGRLLKTDALDHTCGHDLVGAQDLAWDIAGAAAEFDLGESEQARLLGLCGYDTAGRRALFAFMRPCYLAFQLGLWTLADQAGADGGRPAALAERYAAKLRRALRP